MRKKRRNGHHPASRVPRIGICRRQELSLTLSRRFIVDLCWKNYRTHVSWQSIWCIVYKGLSHEEGGPQPYNDQIVIVWNWALSINTHLYQSEFIVYFFHHFSPWYNRYFAQIRIFCFQSASPSRPASLAESTNPGTFPAINYIIHGRFRVFTSGQVILQSWSIKMRLAVLRVPTRESLNFQGSFYAT